MQELAVPMPYLARTIQRATACGATIEVLLEGTDLAVSGIADPDAWVTLRTFASVLSRAARATDDPGIGLAIGLDTKPTAHSWYGYALMTASTVGDACALGIKYLDFRLAPWRVSLVVERDIAVMRFEEKMNLGEARLLVLEYFLGGAIRIAEFLHGRSITADPLLEFRASYSRPAHHARFASQLPRITYDCSVMEARHPAAWLEQPLMLSDREANREATALLDRGLQTTASTETFDRVRALLSDPRNKYPDLVEAAAFLGVSPRTLRRQLRERGVTFRELRATARRDAAIARVTKTNEALGSLARSLGFTTVTSFSRSFQRWTGELPAVFRRRARP